MRAADAAQQDVSGRADRPLTDLDHATAGRDITIAGRDVIYAAPEPLRRALPPAPRAGIPPKPIEHLAGREADLVELHRLLVQSRQVVICGLGGVGKTQLALAYLTQHRDQYHDGRFWLRADEATTFVGDLASLAWRLGLPERALPEQELQIEAVLRWLRAHSDWLLVLDNLDKPMVGEMQHWLPTDLPGHLIITSRSPQGSVTLGVKPLSIDIATEFLLERTGRDDAAAARVIAETLGGLPLALEQAAAYLIENHWRNLADYAELLQSRMAALLREGKPEDYPLPVATTWELSFQRLEQEHPAAADLLRLCAFLAPDDIPISILLEAGEELPDRLQKALEDELECDRAVRALRGYSLVERQGDGLRAHRLLQWVVRDALTAGVQAQWTETAARVLRRTFPANCSEPLTWQRCDLLLPHVLVVVHDGRRLEDELAVSWLMDRAATYLHTRAEYDLARPLMERALEIRERVLGPNHPDTALSLNGMAELLQVQGELTAARPLYERALEIRERVLGPRHPDTASSLGGLAWLLMDQGDLVSARPLMERALGINERMLGPDDPNTAASLGRLADLLAIQGQPAAARPLLERALEIRERVLGPDHPDTATSLNFLGFLLQEQGELTAARPLQERALEIRERVLGPGNSITAISLEDLALVLRAQGELAAARPLMERALEIRERVLGPDHPDTTLSLHSLALLLRDQGELSAARLLHERALEIRERVLGPDHPDTAQSLHSLALLLQDQLEVSGAQPLLARAVEIRERVLGPDHPHTAASRQALESLPRAQDA